MMYDFDGMPSELTTASPVRQGLIVSLLVLLPLAMTVVFLTQSGFVMIAVFFLLGLLFTLRARSKSTSKHRLKAALSERFNGEELLSQVRDFFAGLTVALLIIPISLALSLELSKHAVLAFKDAQHLDLESIAIFTQSIVTVIPHYLYISPFVFAYFCLCAKPEGATATPRQLLFLVCLIVMTFIYYSGSGWVVEMLYLMPVKVSGKEFSDTVSATLNVVLLSIFALVAFCCYYKISIVLFENLVTKDNKLQQYRRSMFGKDLPEDKSVTKEKQGTPKLFGVIERVCLSIESRGLLSVIVANSACLLAIILYLYI